MLSKQAPLNKKNNAKLNKGIMSVKKNAKKQSKPILVRSKKNAKPNKVKPKSASVIQKIANEKLDKPALISMTQQVEVNLNAMLTMIINVLEHYAMKTNIFVQDSTNQLDTIAPGEMALYLYLAAISHISKVGIVAQSAVLVPKDLPWYIPCSYGKWLQGLGPYTEGAFTLTSVIGIIQSLVSARNYPDGSPNTLPGPFLTSTSAFQLARTVRLMQMSSASDASEYVLLPDLSIGHNIATFMAGRAVIVSRKISSYNIAYMSIETIPTFAACGSAYAFPNQAILSESANNCWDSLVCRAYNDVAMLYVGTRTTNLNVSFNNPNAYCIPYSGTNSIAPNTTMNEHFISVFVLCWSYIDIFRPGPVLSTTKYCKLPLRTLRFQNITVDASLLPRHWASAYASVFGAKLGNTTTAIDDYGFGDVEFEIFSCGIALATMIFLRRYNTTAVNYHFYDANSCCQQYYASEVWSNVTMPASFNAAVSDLGPVVHCGMLYCPVLLPRVFTTSNATTPYSLLLGIGVTPSAVATQIFGNPYFVQGDPSVPTVHLDQRLIDSNFIGAVNSIISNKLSQCSCYGINYYARALIGHTAKLWSSFSTGTNFSGQLVHSHQTLCGSVMAMLGSIFYNNDNAGVSDYESIVPYDVNLEGVAAISRRLCSIKRDFFKVFSLVQVSSAQMTRCINSAYNITNNQIVNYKYAVEIGPMSQQAFLLDVYAVTFIQNSTFSQSLAIEQQKLHDKRKELRVGPLSIIEVKHETECFWNDIFNETISALNPVMRRGVGLVGAGLCGSVCSNVAVGLYDWVASNVGTEANDIPYPLKGALKFSKKKLSAEVSLKDKEKKG